MRWSLYLHKFVFNVEYIQGEKNMADFLSRYYQVKEVNDKVNESQNEAILEEYHKASIHGSNRVMKFLIKENYTWKNMYKDIDLYIKNVRNVRIWDKRKL